MIDVFHGDCLEVMAELPDKSIDAVICDPPFGTTQSKWDAVIPFAPMWEQLVRITKTRSPIVLFAAQPFAGALVMSNPKWFKWEDVWDKKAPVGHLNAKRMPLRRHESILVFGLGSVTYNPQMRQGNTHVRGTGGRSTKGAYGQHGDTSYQSSEYYPTSIIEFPRQIGTEHPNQKPVSIMEYLTKTYTNEGSTVLDFTMGSGTTGVACIETGRNFIGIEKDDKYYDVACRRLEEAWEKSKAVVEVETV